MITVVAGLELPVLTALTMPDDEPMVATPVALLVQVPPVGGQLRVVPAPWHRLREPDIGPGAALSVTVIVALHPVPVMV